MFKLTALRAEDLRGRPLRWWALGALALSPVIAGMDNTLLAVSLPTLQREFDASASMLQWIAAAHILSFAGLLLTMGNLGDRFGRARMMRLGLAVFAAASLGAVLSESAVQLIVARAAMGAGGAMFLPCTLSTVNDLFTGAERAKAIAIWVAIGGIGVGIGPVSGGALIVAFSWQAVFIVNIFLPLAALALGARLVPESKDPSYRPLDLLGAVLSTAAMTILVFAIIRVPSDGWTALTVVAGFAAAVVLGTAFVAHELRCPYPLLNLRLFRRPRFTAGVAALGLSFFALFGMMFGMTQYLQFVKELSPLEAGALMLPIAVGFPTGVRVGQRLNARIGTKGSVTLGLLMLTGGFTAIGFYDLGTPYAVIGFIIFYNEFSLGLVMPPSIDAIVGASPRSDAGVGSAVNDISRQVAGALGVAVIGSVMTSLYAGKMAATIAGLGVLSPDQIEAASDSVGSATTIAAQIGGAAGATLDLAARSTFADAMGIAIMAGGGVTFAAALFIARFMPSRNQEYDVAPRS